jgi:hypothetical protein
MKKVLNFLFCPAGVVISIVTGAPAFRKSKLREEGLLVSIKIGFPDIFFNKINKESGLTLVKSKHNCNRG